MSLKMLASVADYYNQKYLTKTSQDDVTLAEIPFKVASIGSPNINWLLDIEFKDRIIYATDMRNAKQKLDSVMINAPRLPSPPDNPSKKSTIELLKYEFMGGSYTIRLLSPKSEIYNEI